MRHAPQVEGCGAGKRFGGVRLVGTRPTREVTHDEVLGMILGAVPADPAPGLPRGDGA